MSCEIAPWIGEADMDLRAASLLEPVRPPATISPRRWGISATRRRLGIVFLPRDNLVDNDAAMDASENSV